MELTKVEKVLLVNNSIERVINTSLKVLSDLDAESQHEDGWINIQDLEELKILVCKLWNNAANEVRREEKKV